VSTRTKILAAAAVLGVLVIVLARGEESSAQLRALEADRMATYVPPGGTLVDSDSQNEGSSLGKPVSARLTRLFKLGAGAGAGGSAPALADATATATSAGWKLAGELGTKRVASGRLELTVVLVEDARLLPDGVQPPALSVSLRHLGE
jgi:hypothetical protein